MSLSRDVDTLARDYVAGANGSLATESGLKFQVWFRLGVDRADPSHPDAELSRPWWADPTIGNFYWKLLRANDDVGGRTRRLLVDYTIQALQDLIDARRISVDVQLQNLPSGKPLIMVNATSAEGKTVTVERAPLGSG